MHFRILKMIATSGFRTALECTKFVFGLGSAQDPAGGVTALPRPFSWFEGVLLLRGEEGKVGEVEERDGRERGGEESRNINSCLRLCCAMCMILY